MTMFKVPVMKCQVAMIMHDSISPSKKFPLAPVNGMGNGRNDVVAVRCLIFNHLPYSFPVSTAHALKLLCVFLLLYQFTICLYSIRMNTP